MVLSCPHLCRVIDQLMLSHIQFVFGGGRFGGLNVFQIQVFNSYDVSLLGLQLFVIFLMCETLYV